MDNNFISLQEFAEKAKKEELFTILETYSKSGATKYYELFLSRDEFLEEEKSKPHKVIYEGKSDDIPLGFLKYSLEQEKNMCIERYYNNNQDVINKSYLETKENEYSLFKKEYRKRNIDFVKSHIPFCVKIDNKENLFLNPTKELIDVLKKEDDYWFEETEFFDLDTYYEIKSSKDLEDFSDEEFMLITVLLKAVKDGHLSINEMGYSKGFWDKYKKL